MKTYRSIMANGTILTRKSDKDYTHAWIVLKNNRVYQSGFSVSLYAAERQSKNWKALLKKVANDRGETVEVEVMIACTEIIK